MIYLIFGCDFDHPPYTSEYLITVLGLKNITKAFIWNSVWSSLCVDCTSYNAWEGTLKAPTPIQVTYGAIQKRLS